MTAQNRQNKATTTKRFLLSDKFSGHSKWTNLSERAVDSFNPTPVRSFVRSLSRSLFPRECAMYNSVVHCRFLFFRGARSPALSFSRLTSMHSAPFLQAPASIPSFSRLVSRVPAVSSHIVMRLRVVRVINSCNSVGLHVLATILPTRISPVVCRN
jgi:hypothetical protein